MEKIINLWYFNKYIQDEIEINIENRQKEKDPYNQMVLDAEKRLLEKVLFKYKELIVNQ